MNILTTAAKVSINTHKLIQIVNWSMEKKSNKQNNIKNKLNALNIKEVNKTIQYKKQQKKRNLIMRQIWQRIKEEKAKKI